MEAGTLYWNLPYLFEQVKIGISKATARLLLIPDLINYLLTGQMKTEMSIASTTQLLNPITKKWNHSLIKKLQLPITIFTWIVEAGNFLGTIKSELGLPQIPVYNVCAHDTASAVVSVPNEHKCLFVSCGTWSLVGTELSHPLLTHKSQQYNLTNESGINRTTRLLKNITGLWIIQELKRNFMTKGKRYSYQDLEKIAWEAVPFRCLIDTDDPIFSLPGDIIQRIRAFTEKTGQDVPKTDGEMVRCVYESLAFKYKQTFLEIMDTIGFELNVVNMVGGGIQAHILFEMVANASGLMVLAGPVEAAAMGNIMVQLMKQGAIKSLVEGRQWLKRISEIQEYQPRNTELWQQHFDHYLSIVK